MKTCNLISCWRKQKCHLEAQGMEDLCPAVKEIVEEAKEKTERAWREQTHSSQIVPLTRFRGTVRTITDNFSIEVALQHMRNYEAARRKKFIADRDFERKWEVRIVDPGPMPKAWLPQSENNKFYDGATNIEDRSAVITGVNPVTSVAKLVKAHKIITRQERYERDHWKMDAKLQFNENLRQEKIMNMLEAAEV